MNTKDSMSTRSTVLPDERFVSLRLALEERMREAARTVSPENFSDFIDAATRAAMSNCLGAVGANEGAVWLADPTRENLVVAFNCGPNASELVGGFKQSLSAGMISLVFASEQPLCENEVYKNQRQDKTLDQKLGVLTVAMMVVPFYFVHELRGVVSCVRLKNARSPEPDPPAFSLDDLRALQTTVDLISTTIDHRLLSATVGWGDQ
jgi:GAF domain-containing protein